MLITNIFLYHQKLSKYGIKSEKLQNSIMNITGAYKRQIKIYTDVQGRKSQEEEELGVPRGPKKSVILR